MHNKNDLCVHKQFQKAAVFKFGNSERDRILRGERREKVLVAITSWAYTGLHDHRIKQW
jgi:hypothetical protein